MIASETLRSLFYSHGQKVGKMKPSAGKKISQEAYSQARSGWRQRKKSTNVRHLSQRSQSPVGPVWWRQEDKKAKMIFLETTTSAAKTATNEQVKSPVVSRSEEQLKETKNRPISFLLSKERLTSTRDYLERTRKRREPKKAKAEKLESDLHKIKKHIKETERKV